MGVFQRTATTLVNKAGKTLVDLVLNANSNEPIANSAVTAKFNQIDADLSGLKFRNNNNIPEVSVDGGTTWIPMLSNLISQETYTLIGTSQATIIPPAGATYIRIRYNNKSDYVTPYVVINNVTSALTSNYVTYAINGNFKIKLVDQFSGNSSGFDINYYRIQP